MSFDLRSFTDRLCSLATTAGHEADAADWVRERLDALGFETYAWSPDPDRLAAHPSFPDDPDAIDVDGRESVAGVLEFGDPSAGSTLLLNGHLDVVPADDELWDTDPFEPVRESDAGTGSEETLTCRGAADMKSGLAACVGAALDVGRRHERGELDLDGRLVVEAVAGEEDGGYGAAAAALENPYPFERDAAIIPEPTELRPVTTCAGCLMMRLELAGRSAHAATRWVGEDVLPRFEAIRTAFRDLECERTDRVTHPLYEDFPVPWPVVAGRVEAGSWASTVPASLSAEFRIGVAPGETVADVETEFRDRLAEVADDDPWLRERPPTFERFSVQFEPSEVDAEKPVVRALRRGMEASGLDDAAPRGATYGADARHYIDAGIPTVLFGPGTVEEAHFPNETIRWDDVELARETLAETAAEYLKASE